MSVGLIVGISAGATALIILLALLLFYHFQQRDRLAKRLRKGTTREYSTLCSLVQYTICSLVHYTA